MQLRFATWNICFGSQLQEVLNTIRSQTDFQGLDIFAIQEASIHNGVEDAAAIASALGPDYIYYQQTAQTSKGLLQANALIWNKKQIHITARDVLLLPTYKEVHIGRIEKTIKMILPQEKRNSLVIEGKIGSKSFRIYAAHFDVIGFAHKKEQLHHLLKDDLSRGEVDFNCIAGDLNTFKIIKRPSWTDLNDIAREHGFTDITSEITWTFRNKHFRFRQKTDAIFLKQSSGGTVSSWSKNVPGSDHIPVFAIIGL